MTDPRGPVFAAVRDRLPDVWNTQANIDLMDETLDRLGFPREVSMPVPDFEPKDRGELEIGDEGIALIKEFEGCARIRQDGMVEAYPDPATGREPWTIGWGATGPGIAKGTVWTREQCDRRLERDLVKYADEVRSAIGQAPTSQAQFDALVSFHYNTGAIATATLTKRHKSGDYDGAIHEFGKWIRGGGREIPGLVRRRAAEAELYRSGS